MRADSELQQVGQDHLAYSVDIRRSIEAALERPARREAACVHIEVENGYARLSGTVRSWAAWRRIHDAAENTPGVRRLDDLIQITPDLG